MKNSSASRFTSRLLPIAALVMMLGTGSALAFEPFKIRDIRVEGSQRTEAGTIFSYLPVKVGEEFNDDKATTSLKALYATGFFKDVRIEIERDVLVVIVEERPAIASVEFTGTKEFDKDTLKKALKDIGLGEAQIFDRSVLDRAEQELKRQYLTRGKYGAAVTTTVTPLERNRVAITFNVDEGDVATIKQISIIGNKAFSTKELLRELSLTTPGWFTWYSRSDQYSKPKLTGDLETLRSFYLNRGYLEFNIESTQVSITPDKKDIYLTINITEGDKYTVSDVKLAGEALINEDELKKYILIKPGDVYSAERLNESTKRIQDRLGVAGYAFANANAAPQLDREKRQVAFTIFVDPGRRVYVRRVNITGNTRTRDEVVRREMRQIEDGWYDIDKIKLSRERLERLSFFKDVTVETPQVAGLPDQVDVNVAVTERPTGSFNIGAGFSSTEKLVLTTSIQQANLFGSGQTAGLQLDTSRSSRTIAVSETDPYYTIDGISRSVDLYFRTTNPSTLSLGNYQIRSTGAGLSFGVPFTEIDTVFFGARAEGTKLVVDSTSPLNYQNYVLTYGENSAALLGTVGWARDSRNNVLAPTAGRYQRANFEITVPAGQLRYYRTSYQQTYYYPLSHDFTLSLNGEADLGRGFGGKPYPIFKNYYAGGIGSVRGFDSSSLGPRDINGNPIGGTTRINANAEMLFPIPGTGTDRSFRGFAFFDTGNVYGENQPITAHELRASYGVGLNWLSPIGALRLSFGIPVRLKDTDHIQRLQFTIGNGF